jgi:hypothetical protein
MLGCLISNTMAKRSVGDTWRDTTSVIYFAEFGAAEMIRGSSEAG